MPVKIWQKEDTEGRNEKGEMEKGGAGIKEPTSKITTWSAIIVMFASWSGRPNPGFKYLSPDQ